MKKKGTVEPASERSGSLKHFEYVSENYHCPVCPDASCAVKTGRAAGVTVLFLIRQGMNFCTFWPTHFFAFGSLYGPVSVSCFIILSVICIRALLVT